MTYLPILKIRAEALRANLAKISRHLASVPDRRKDLTDLDQQIDQMRQSVWPLLKKVRDAKTQFAFAVDSVRRNTPPKIDVADITAAEGQVEAFIEQLNELQRVVTRMREKCFRIQEQPVGEAITKDLDERTKDPLAQLRSLDVNLTKAKPSQASWTSFSSNATESQQIFAEYIEFLGGLALRDTGFDEGISKLADDLLKTYGKSFKGYADSMLAIPTRQQAVAMTLANVIRVTFPDWTIWALPSTAREFWHVVAQKQIGVDLNFELSELSGAADDTAELRFKECLADAFATYTMGPAYACLAVYQLLNPSAPYKASANDDAPDELRAHAIIEMLACMDSKENEFDPPYRAVRDNLKNAWLDAIAEVGAAPTPEEQGQIATDQPRVTLLVKALSAALDKSGMPPFTVDIWDEVVDKWVTPLVQGQSDQIKIPGGAELRHVLNAAWCARVQSGRPLNLDLTRPVSDLATRILNPIPIAV